MVIKSIPNLQPLTEKKLFFLILLGSFILKGILVFSLQVPNPDGIVYINAAREFSQGNFHQGIQIFPMPLYPLLISLLHYIIPDWLRAAQTISWLSITLTTIPLYQITKILFGRKSALWCSLAYSLAPHFNTYASQLIRGPLGLFMLTMGVLFALKSLRENRIRNFYLVSLFSLLAFFSRVEFFLFPLFLLFVYLGIILFNHRHSLFISKGIGAFLITPLAAGILLWLVIGESFGHAFRLPELKHYFQLAIKVDFLSNYHNISQQLQSLSKSLPNPFYTGNFAETSRHYIWFIYLIPLAETVSKLIFPTNIIPLLYKSPAEKYNRNHFFIIGIIFLFTASSYFFLISNNFIQKRYLMIPAFFLFPWIGNGLYHLYNLAANYNNKKNLAVGLFILLFLLAPTIKTIRYAGENNISLKDAGLWLEHHLGAKKDIMLISNDKRIPFFAHLDKSFILIPFEDLQQIEDYARKNKGQLISLVISQKRKNLLPAFKNYKIIQEFHDRKNIVIIAEDKHDNFLRNIKNNNIND
ncbi:MAG: glycosyltransferase family 39 protein [Pseudomonadota bacterium]|nr:glycosyltransferase family 39 protein [Pseudomonadota bacterium]